MSAPVRPMSVLVLAIWKMCPVAAPWITASEKRLSLGSSSTPALCRSRPVIVDPASPTGVSGGAGFVLLVSGGEDGAGNEGGEAARAATIGAGGSVCEARRGFSISIVAPHLAHL